MVARTIITGTRFSSVQPASCPIVVVEDRKGEVWMGLRGCVAALVVGLLVGCGEVASEHTDGGSTHMSLDGRATSNSSTTGSQSGSSSIVSSASSTSSGSQSSSSSVVGSSSSRSVVSSSSSSSVGSSSSSISCPSDCADGCSNGTCEIDCNGPSACQKSAGVTVTCAPDLPCDINCNGGDACSGLTIVCPTTSACTVNCLVGAACLMASVVCGDGPCNVMCTPSMGGPIKSIDGCGSNCTNTCKVGE